MIQTLSVVLKYKSENMMHSVTFVFFKKKQYEDNSEINAFLPLRGDLHN